ncbi:MAG: hypothetical protein ACO1SV_03200 [Fimbriimonas sp.]
MIAALLLLPLGPQATLDFDADATSVANVVAKLAERTHTKLKASPKVGAEIVFVRAKGVNVEELKAKLAEAIYGSWTQDGDTLTLTRQAADERAIWTRHVSLRRQYVDSELERIRKLVAVPFDGASLAKDFQAFNNAEPSDPQAARKRYELQTALFGRGPAMRLLYRLLLACNPNDLAGIGPYSRTVFRLNPTPMQKGFDANKYRQALADYAREQTDWKDEAAAVNFGIDRNSSTVSDPRIQLNLGDLSRVEPGLNISRGEMAALLSANLVGESQSFGRQILCQASLADPSRKFLDAMIAPPPAAQDDPDIVLSAPSQEFQRMLQTTFFGGSSEPLSEKSMQLLLHPDEIDPAGFGTNEVLKAYGDVKKLNVVAAVPDDVLGSLWFTARQGPLKLHKGLNAILNAGNVDLKEGSGWAVFTHGDPYESPATFTPRAPMAALMKALVGKGRLDLRDYARFAFGSGRVSRAGLSEYYMAFFDRTSLGALDRTDWNGLSLYGSFDATQQKGLDGGVRIPIGPLSAAQKSIIGRIAYAGEIRSESQLGDGSAMLSNQAVEPTETFASGLPAGGVVTAKTKAIPTVVAYAKSPDGKVRPLRGLNVWTLAAVENDVLGDARKMRDYGVPGLVGYAPGFDKMVALRVELMPNVWKEMPLTMPEYDATATPVPWQRLPEPWPKQIRDAIEQNKAQKANQPVQTIPPR